MKFETVFFDFDGVLLDTLEAKGRAFQKVFSRFGGKVADQVYDFHLNHGGLNRKQKIQECHRRFVGSEISEELLNEMLSLLATEMQNQLFSCVPVSGALQFMKSHREAGGRAWVVSAAPENEIKDLCVHFGYAPYLEGIHGFPNPKSEQMKKVLAQFSLNHKNCVMIGDAQEDLKAALENQVPFLLRKTPYSTFAKEYQGLSIADFNSIQQALEKL
ncbi:MAG: HAD family hydrolase [Pseudobdellovibrionaceae bacterium]